MHRLSRFVLCTALIGLTMIAPRSASAVVAVNAASFANPAMPNGGIAQGSLFVGFGSGMGPDTLTLPDPWPFPTTLAGTSVQVEVAGTAVDCFVVYTSANQIAAILPSNTPVGTGILTVRNNGAVADTGSITVVPHSFGIFTINQQGYGPIVGTDPLNGTAVYSVRNSPTPEGLIDIWGTGLGAVSFPDEGPPSPASLGYDVQVYIGDQQAAVVYAGRSGCCSAIDLIRVAAPSNLAGCFLPVTVVVEGVTSNYGTLPIDGDGGDCTPDVVFEGFDATNLSDGGSYRVGNIALIRTRFDLGGNLPTIPQVAQITDTEFVSDAFAASYEEVQTVNVQAFAAIQPVNHVGSCSAFQFVGSAEYPSATVLRSLSAGPSLEIQTGSKVDQVPRQGNGYTRSFGLETAFLTPLQKGQFTIPTFYEAGLATVTAPGGPDVSRHSASVVIPQPVEWRNRQVATNGIRRSAPLTVEYSAQGYDFVNIRLFSSAIADPNNPEGDVIGALFCAADPNASSFTIPAHALSALPRSAVVDGTSTGAMWVGGWKFNSFDADGIDTGTIYYTDTNTTIGVDIN